MEEIRGEGGKHVLKYSPGSSCNTSGAVQTAAGPPGGARGGASGAAGRENCAGAGFLYGTLDCGTLGLRRNQKAN